MAPRDSLTRMEKPGKGKRPFQVAMLALGAATFFVSTFLNEGGLRWAGRCIAAAFFILALVSFVRGAAKPD